MHRYMYKTNSASIRPQQSLPLRSLSENTNHLGKFNCTAGLQFKKIEFVVMLHVVKQLSPNF